MRKNQWNVLGWIFLVISVYFLFWFYLAIPSDDVSVIVSRIYSIAFLITFGFSMACLINGGREGKAEEKEESEKFFQFLDERRDSVEKEFVMEVAHKIKLEHLPQNIAELVFWGKKEGKEKEVEEAVKEWPERDPSRVTNLKKEWKLCKALKKI